MNDFNDTCDVVFPHRQGSLVRRAAHFVYMCAAHSPRVVDFPPRVVDPCPPTRRFAFLLFFAFLGYLHFFHIFSSAASRLLFARIVRISLGAE